MKEDKGTQTAGRWRKGTDGDEDECLNGSNQSSWSFHVEKQHRDGGTKLENESLWHCCMWLKALC